MYRVEEYSREAFVFQIYEVPFFNRSSRRLQVVYLLVDHYHGKHPKLKRDAFWDELNPQLPETKITARNVNNPQLGSAFNME